MRRTLALCLSASLSLLAACHSTPSATHQPSSGMDAIAHADRVGVYLDAKDVPFATLLPAAPVDGGALTRGEIDLMLALRAEAKLDSEARAKSEDTFTPWTFADVLGPNFAASKMPKTRALMEQVERDTHAVTELAKQNWGRKRPPLQDPQLTPWVPTPKSASYPSGHATRAIVFASVLAELAPEHKDHLMARARLVALDRVLAQIHFPTDVASGMGLGYDIVDRLNRSEAFQRDMQAARAEWPVK